jgi:UDP-N-acetylglucosamine 4,6-dehydratase (inverting)
VLENKRILVTGGTGSFGKVFVDMSLRKFESCEIIVFSRDEMKQWDMGLTYASEPRVSFIIGDVRDSARLLSALADVDYVVHAAATKIIPIAEHNPFECIKTNVLGAMNLIESIEKTAVKKVVALSTDKACNPINLYGATKLASDKLFVSANERDRDHETKFSVVRYGNVMGSRGSIIPFFWSLRNASTLPITDVAMTRFMITLEEAVNLVWHAFHEMKGGEIFVKKIPSMKVIDVASAIAPDAKHHIIGIRPGEKLHEQMISSDDAYSTYEYSDHYKILPTMHGWAKDPQRIGDGIKVSAGFAYSSIENPAWMSIDELKQWISQNEALLSKP